MSKSVYPMRYGLQYNMDSGLHIVLQSVRVLCIWHFAISTIKYNHVYTHSTELGKLLFKNNFHKFGPQASKNVSSQNAILENREICWKTYSA